MPPPDAQVFMEFCHSGRSTIFAKRRLCGVEEPAVSPDLGPLRPTKNSSFPWNSGASAHSEFCRCWETIPNLTKFCHSDRSTIFAKRRLCGVEEPAVSRPNHEPLPNTTPPPAPWKSGASAPRNPSQPTQGFSPRNCEYTMNWPCGKQIRPLRTTPVIIGDTTGCVSLLTGTIRGINFAIPWL
jgi:hypothetical protein